MKKSIITAIVLCIVIVFSCNKATDSSITNTTTTATLSSATLSTTTFANSGIAQATTLTIGYQMPPQQPLRLLL